ncbi:hypothetical protein EDD22DRAFT_1000042 [Suillus occidentalis]|nr:hypothetical protein EDD22DRAFT_1000042 [Suillus occidentalis]
MQMLIPSQSETTPLAIRRLHLQLERLKRIDGPVRFVRSETAGSLSPSFRSTSKYFETEEMRMIAHQSLRYLQSLLPLLLPFALGACDLVHVHPPEVKNDLKGVPVPPAESDTAHFKPWGGEVHVWASTSFPVSRPTHRCLSCLEQPPYHYPWSVGKGFKKGDQEDDLRGAMDEAAKSDAPKQRISSCNLPALFCEESDLDSSFYRIDWALDVSFKSVPKVELQSLVGPPAPDDGENFDKLIKSDEGPQLTIPATHETHSNVSNGSRLASPSKVDFDMSPYQLQQELLATRLQLESQVTQILSPGNCSPVTPQNFHQTLHEMDEVVTNATFRLIVLGFMLANKWLDDHTFSNKTWTASVMPSIVDKTRPYEGLAHHHLASCFCLAPRHHPLSSQTGEFTSSTSDVSPPRSSSLPPEEKSLGFIPPLRQF